MACIGGPVEVTRQHPWGDQKDDKLPACMGTALVSNRVMQVRRHSQGTLPFYPYLPTKVNGVGRVSGGTNL